VVDLAAAPLLTDPRVINLCAVDLEYFCHTFFPKAFRGDSPDFAPRLNSALENPAHRLLNLRGEDHEASRLPSTPGRLRDIQNDPLRWSE
jgi:hypothetical protein